MKISKQIKTGLIVLVPTILLLAAKHPAIAQQVVKIAAIPPRVEDLTANPGETIINQIKVRNEGDAEIALNAKVYDIIVEDDSGTPTFVTDPEIQQDNRWSMASWITVSPTRFILKPGETQVLDLIVIAPQDALPGGHYAAVAYQTADQPIAQGSAAQVIPSVASLIYLTVPGDITENALVRRLQIPKFSEFGPIKILTEIENLSDIHIKPLGLIRIYNSFNQLSTSLKLDEYNIFPNKTRIFENNWERKWLFGRYKAQLEAAYGNQGQALLATVYFWVLPWRIMLVALLVITLVILLAIYLKKKNDIEIQQKQENQKPA